ncbi:MAG: hypothetical protein HY221_00615 [Candidatus Sungbacteria bacterium]|uniref:Uncharacterized protein n=1 Tax=Candidatus Sungiibacteriota bacterium TaxID=2750080 RepID=A0A932QXV1_9BACT|nr:hypothetical protein [Candidatus Sungbacteria bacterium]
MNIATIPKKLAQKGDLVVIPRKGYEELATLRSLMPVVEPSREEMRIIRRGEKEIRDGKYTPRSKIRHELARRSH